MAIGSNNPFPSVLFVEGSAPSSPAATNFRLYYDSADHLLKWKNSAGTVTTVGAGSASPGYEFDYATWGTSVNVTKTGSDDANTDLIVAGNAVTYDGATKVLVQAFIPSATKGTTYTQFWLFDGTTQLAAWGVCQIAGGMSIKLERELTPSAAAHTYKLKASVDGATGTATGGAGTAGVYVPGFIRITRV